MIKMVNFTGQDAIDIAIASNKQPEAFDSISKSWRPILMWTAAAIASRNPEHLRIRGPARTIAEAVLGRSLPNSPGIGLAAQVRSTHSSLHEQSKISSVRAVALILNALEDDGA